MKPIYIQFREGLGTPLQRYLSSSLMNLIWDFLCNPFSNSLFRSPTVLLSRSLRSSFEQLQKEY